MNEALLTELNENLKKLLSPAKPKKERKSFAELVEEDSKRRKLQYLKKSLKK